MPRYRHKSGDEDDYYKRLGVGREATQEEIKKSFRKLSKELHSDSNSNGTTPEMDERYKGITEAYSTLYDPAKRKHYDYLNPNAGIATSPESSAEPKTSANQPRTGPTSQPATPRSRPNPDRPVGPKTSQATKPNPESLFDDDEGIPVDWELTPPRRPPHVWVGALLPVVVSLALTVFVFESGTISQSDFVQHPPSGLLHLVALALGLIFGFIAIFRVFLGLFMVMVTLGFIYIGAREFEKY
ncbi:MAG TPA: DnaJ domain-containing protein [Candidatus Saccharimonadales bacterium]|nr:DnaJ domain-containing protein [Candidatus Saccharimonadales bacterium]